MNTLARRDGWPAWLSMNGFVLRSLDIRGATAIEAERICGFRFGLFAQGVALYRLDDGIVRQFLRDPPNSLHLLDLYIVGFNDERGPRDWDAVQIAAYYGDVAYNGYDDERMVANAAWFSPSAARIGREQAHDVLLLAAELSNLYARDGFIGKLLFRSKRPQGRAPHETYPPGGGIREYQLLRRQSFRYVTSCTEIEVRSGGKLDW